MSHVSCVETQERYLVDPCHLVGEVNGETDLGRVSGVLQENQVLLVGLRYDSSQVRDYNDYKDLL